MRLNARPLACAGALKPTRVTTSRFPDLDRGILNVGIGPHSMPLSTFPDPLATPAYVTSTLMSGVHEVVGAYVVYTSLST
jgi:hypothetical protein